MVNKKWYITSGAGLGIIFGFTILNAATGLVFGAAAGLILYELNKVGK
jgi:uncharacterized membrane protein